MPKRAIFERSREELSLDVSIGVHILLVVEQSSLESQSRGVPRLRYLRYIDTVFHFLYDWLYRGRQAGTLKNLMCACF